VRWLRIILLFSSFESLALAQGVVLHGVVILNEVGGAGVAGAGISAEGANDTQTFAGGKFDLVFRDKKVGDSVAVRVSRSGYVVVNWIQQQLNLSLLIGTMRTLAHFTESPGEILASMNQRMLARGAGGFKTCLVLRADAGGAITVANAGHLAPYCAHAELPLQNGLPLGLGAKAAYAESTFHLA
jgi:hypothetical protein